MRVRQAVNMAIDRDTILKDVYQGAGQKAKNPIPPTIWSYDDATQDYAYDPEKAKALLKEAGVENLVDRSVVDAGAASLQPQRQAHGRDHAGRSRQGRHQRPSSRVFEWGEYRKRLQQGEHQMGLLGWTGDNGDPDNFFFLLGCTGAREGGQNIAKWCNQGVRGQSVRRRKLITDMAERTKIYQSHAG